MTYYVMLPMFKVELKEDGEFEMICNKFLGWIFEVFFAPFWNGKIKVRKG